MAVVAASPDVQLLGSLLDARYGDTTVRDDTGGCNSFTRQSLLAAETDPFRLDAQFECSRTYSHQYDEAVPKILTNDHSCLVIPNHT
jgi:hypothetical protein